jgi:hypothetical protein
MNTLAVRLAVACTLAALAGCNQGNSAHRDDPQGTPGEQVGHAAYVAEKDAKKAVKEVAQDVKTFSHDAREGFKEEKQKDQEHKTAPPSTDAR